MRDDRAATMRDLLVMALGLAALLALAYRANLIAGWGAHNTLLSPWGTGELLLTLLYLMIALAFFAWRRAREQRRATAALNTARAAREAGAARLRFVLHHAPVVLFALDGEGMITLIEGRGLAGSGLNPSDLIRRSVFDLFADHPQIPCLVSRALVGEEFAATVEIAQSAFDTQHVVLRDARGTTIEVIGVATNVTARRQAEQALHRCEIQRAREWTSWRCRQLHLSERESEVLDALGAGQGNAAIAAALHIEPKTVGTHIHNIGTKLGLPGRIAREAVLAAAREQGLLPLPPQRATASRAPSNQVDNPVA